LLGWDFDLDSVDAEFGDAGTSEVEEHVLEISQLEDDLHDTIVFLSLLEVEETVVLDSRSDTVGSGFGVLLSENNRGFGCHIEVNVINCLPSTFIGFPIIKESCQNFIKFVTITIKI